VATGPTSESVIDTTELDNLLKSDRGVLKKTRTISTKESPLEANRGVGNTTEADKGTVSPEAKKAKDKQRTVITMNINGGLRHKIDDINRILKKQTPDLLFIQECKVTEETTRFIQNKFPGYKAVFNCKSKEQLSNEYIDRKLNKPNPPRKEEINPQGYTANGGLLTLINKKLDGKCEYILDPERQYTMVIEKGRLESVIYCNIYGPAANDAERKTQSKIIVGGDFNITQSMLDRANYNSKQKKDFSKGQGTQTKYNIPGIKR